MMANSAMKEGERDRNKRQIGVGLQRIFLGAVKSAIKDKEKYENAKRQFIEQFEAENSSKKNSNEPTAVATKQSTHYPEKFSPSSSKVSDNHTKNILNSCQSVENEAVPDNDIQTFRMSSSYSSNSGEYINAGHNYNTKRSHKFSSNSKSYDNNARSEHSKFSDTYQGEWPSSNDKSCKHHIKTPSNSKLSFHQNDDSHNFIPRMRKPARINYNLNDSSKHITNAKDDYHNDKRINSKFSNTDSHSDSSPSKTVQYNSNSNQDYSSNILSKNSSKGNSNFRNFSYRLSQDHHSCNSTKKIKFPSQQHDFQKVSFNRNPSKSDQYMKLEENNLGILDQTTEINDMEEGSFSDSNLDLESHFEDDNTEIKHQRVCLELDETLKISSENKMWKNIRITCQPIHDSITTVCPISNTSSMPSVSNAQVSPTLNTPIPPVSSTPVSPVSNVSSVFPVETTSSECIISDFSPALTLEAGPPLTLFDVFDDKSLTNDNGIVVCSDDDIIPPPVDPFTASDILCSSAEKSITLLQNIESESAEESLYEDDYFPLPESAHIEAISNFIFKTVKERSVPFTVADKVVNDLQRLFKNHFEGNVIDYYGSYYTHLAITTSDINLVIKADVSVKKSFMYEIYKILLNELQKYHVLPYDEGNNIYKSKINLTHPDTGINCELTYLGRSKEEKYFKMGKFLRMMWNIDGRVKPLIIVTKVWAEHFNINEVEDGKLHPIGFALLVIHFLQHCENPVLPIYCEEQDVKDMKQDLPENNLPIGALWLSFLKYYAFTFNWQEDILTITSVDRVSKRSKKWENFWVAIEDPFTGKNIAASVINRDVADHIKSCFRHTYNHFLNGKEIVYSSDNDESQGGTESGSSQLEFSFNDCSVEQSEDICERCEEIDDICDECKKKIYVQPMASVPKMTDDFLKVVRKALFTVYDKYMLSDKEVEERKQFVRKLEIDVRKIYWDAEMSIFGSSVNGFGFKKSDLDICMTFKSKKEFKAFVVLRSLRRLLQRDNDFADVIAIFNAQIPILKFRYKPKGWRGDISLNNVLAVHNSELLHTYSLIDDRAKILGCAVKLIAKKALIADVTEKALSSYSYLIMVIHFLQQTDPPVLPVLQDAQFRDNYELGHIVDNCNVWFCKNTDNIGKLFKIENHTPVEQLFLDLLDYYCSFDYESVITIRQKEILTLPFCEGKHEGMRSARLFNIQDPFLLNKNLGCVVSSAKAQETKSIFNRARMLFRTPKKELPTDLENHFFSTMSLTGRIQKEVLCDCCGKFGHDQNDCKQSFPLKNNFFKYHPRRNQYVNRNAIFKKKQMNRPYIKENL